MGAVGVKVIVEIFTGMPWYAYSRNPYIVTGIGVVGAMVADIESDPIIKDMKEKNLETDEQKKMRRRQEGEVHAKWL